MEQEIWKPVVGLEGLYEVSNKGRVRSVDRDIIRSDGKVQHKKGIVLKQVYHKQRLSLRYGKQGLQAAS